MSALTPQAQSSHTMSDQTSTVIGNSCMVIVLCSAAVLGRFVARWMVKTRIEADDYLTIVALFAIVVLAIEQFCLAHYGIGKDPSTLPASSTIAIAKVQFASQLTYNAALALSKASILMLYRRIFSLRTTWFRICWWINAAMVAIYFIFLFVTFMIQCKPHSVSALWNDKKDCNPKDQAAQIAGIINIVIDFSILIMPLPMVWALQMPRRQKTAVSGVFLLGLIGCAVSAARVIRIPNSEVFNPHGVAFVIWSVDEPAVALICACLPTLRPLFRGALNVATSHSRSWGRTHKSQSQTRPYRPTTDEEGQPFRAGSPVPLFKGNVSTNICAHDDVHQSYSMDDVHPLRPKELPERTSSRALDVDPPTPRKDRSAAALV